MQVTNPVAEKPVELHRMSLTPRWDDMDALGHINSLAYLAYMQECRVQWLAGLTLSHNKIMPVIVNIQADYIQELVYPVTLEIIMYGSEPGNSSFLTTYEIWAKNQETFLSATGYAKLVWIDIEKRKAVRLDESVRKLLH